MIVVAALAAVVASVQCTGGNLAALARLDVRRPMLAIGGLALQFLVVSAIPALPTWLAVTVHAGSYAIAAAFLAANRHVRWMWAVGAGAAANAVAIAANGGVMPASAWAYETAGLAAPGHAFANSQPVDHPRLLALGDVFAIPARWPLANVFSIGDVVLVVGSALMLHAACRVPRRSRRDFA